MTFKADITPEYIVDYNVAHSLHRYGYGSKLISKFLKRSVSQIGWWLENDKMHSGIKYSKRAVNKKLNEIKHYVTEQNIGFFLVKEIQKEELNISGAYLGRFIGESKDSVNEWRKGGVPALVKEGFRDEHVIAEQYETLVTQIKYDDTKNRIMYYLAMEVYHKVKQKYPNGKIGCETISRILGEYFKKKVPIARIHYWLIGCKDLSFEQLKDQELVAKEMKNLEEMLTVNNLGHHIAIELDARNVPIIKISKELDIPYEKLYYWKHRGSKLIKTFKDEEVVAKAVELILSGKNYKKVKELFNSKFSSGFCPNCNTLMKSSKEYLGHVFACERCIKEDTIEDNLED